ncbi:hypothetical protein [Lachnospira multipara]|uniref:hypothetical protein n=1 Tax=Lachnospira multipara TaxID=28051 RepID=UPI0004E23006|nr:hypothetical protein [Lachnospira multipara]
MDNKEHIQAETNYIFNYDFNDNDIPEEVEEEYYDRASALLDEYSWNDIFNCWFDYVKTRSRVLHAGFGSASADKFLSESVRILAERLTQSELVLRLS